MTTYNINMDNSTMDDNINMDSTITGSVMTT